jgi:hypothetical protein
MPVRWASKYCRFAEWVGTTLRLCTDDIETHHLQLYISSKLSRDENVADIFQRRKMLAKEVTKGLKSWGLARRLNRCIIRTLEAKNKQEITSHISRIQS